MWVVHAQIFVLYCERYLGSRFSTALGTVKKSGWSVSWQDSNWEFPNSSIYLMLSIYLVTLPRMLHSTPISSSLLPLFLQHLMSSSNYEILLYSVTVFVMCSRLESEIYSLCDVIEGCVSLRNFVLGARRNTQAWCMFRFRVLARNICFYAWTLKQSAFHSESRVKPAARESMERWVGVVFWIVGACLHSPSPETGCQNFRSLNI
jgi:hypothetical protein